MSPKGIAAQPVNGVKWVDRDTLKANDYNPNVVAPPELDLLKVSIIEDGWTQPIVVLDDMTIVDGFHRWTVSACKELRELTDGKVPVVVIAADPVHRKMSTIRHNRARGTHVVVRMGEIVRSMLEADVPGEQLEKRLGMEDEEIVRLADRAGTPPKFIQRLFGKAWAPRRE